MTKKKATLNDSLTSLYTSLGAKSESISYSGKKISDNQLKYAYANSWLTAKYIDKTTKDMLKLPRIFNGDYNEELLLEVFKKEKRLKLKDARAHFLSMGALYGDSMIVAITDAVDLTRPVGDNEDIKRFIVLTKGEYTPDTNLDDDLTSNNFCKPIHYTLKNNVKVHHSRCHRLKLGLNKLTDKIQYGTSDLQDKHENIKLFDATITSIFDLIQDSNIDVIYLPGLLQLVSAGKEEDVYKLMQTMSLTKSSLNALVLDAGNSEAQGRWEQKTANYSGLSEVLTKLVTVTAGALDRPVTVLFGLSASGFSSGEEDLKSYYGTINSLQESRLREFDEFVDQFILNKLMPNNNLEFEYPSIEPVSEETEATIFNTFVTALSTAVTSGVITDRVAQTEMIARGLLKNTTEDDFKDGDLFTTSEYPERS